MSISTNPTHDVLIAGAGPVGLFLACELRLAGCSVLMLEQARDPSSPLKGPPFGLRGLSVTTIESLDRRGLLEAIKDRAATTDTAGAHWMKQQRRPGGHFAGIPFFHDQVDGGKWPFRLSGPISNMAADMAGIEAVLGARAIESGVEIRRGCEVENVEQWSDGVRVRASAEVFRASWLVGCDGGRSAVRKAAGIHFSGTEPEFTGYSVQATLADPEKLQPGRHYTEAGMYLFTPPDTIAMVDFDGGAFHRTQPVTRERVDAVVRRVSCTDVAVAALGQVTTWTDRAFLASEYRKGRVLLAGDAAHVHSPLGGQGLNLGLGDSMNLGWKLAATIRGDAPAGLLDTYSSERQPIAAQVLDWSRAQVLLMRPNRSSRAMADILRDLIATDDGATYFAERVWGVGLRYEPGTGHALAGRSAPDFQLSDGTRLNEHLRAGKAVLLDFDGSEALRAAAAPWQRKLHYLATEVRDRLGLSALLVRPDGFIAWATDTDGDVGGVVQAMQQWLGIHLPA